MEGNSCQKKYYPEHIKDSENIIVGKPNYFRGLKIWRDPSPNGIHREQLTISNMFNKPNYKRKIN